VHYFFKFERFSFGCGSLELLRQAENDCDDATAKGLSKSEGQEGELIGVSAAAGVEIFGGALRGPARKSRCEDVVEGVRGNVMGSARFTFVMKTGKNVCLGDQIALGGENDDESLGVLFECPVSDGVGQREASEIGVVEEDVACVPRQVPHGLDGRQCSTAQEAMHSRDHETPFGRIGGVYIETEC